MKLSGWGNYPVADVHLGHVRYVDEAPSCLDIADTLIPRGNGRSYGDAALNSELTLSTLALSRIRAFDRTAGRITVEAGALLSDLLPLMVAAGWFSPVTPGTKFVTIGGMAAADVHGKNHHGAGSFAHHIESLELLGADGRVRTCSSRAHPELFAATIGGMGLTGLILTVTFLLLPIRTAWMRQESLACGDLDSVMVALDDADDWTYSVAWIDCAARGAHLGRSLIYCAEHAQPDDLPPAHRGQPLEMPVRRSLSVPFFFPGRLINQTSVRTFNALYYRYQTVRAGPSLVDLDTYFFPLDAIHHWNRIYGRAGFTQHQCVLPTKTAREGLRELLGQIGRAGSGSFLAVLKRLGPGRDGLSFPMEGYTLALDFPVSSDNLALLDDLDTVVAAHGGRIYLAKDARTNRSVMHSGYNEVAEFTARRRAPESGGNRFESLLSRRLEL